VVLKNRRLSNGGFSLRKIVEKISHEKTKKPEKSGQKLLTKYGKYCINMAYIGYIAASNDQ
jgi:hypothetical protein